MYERGYVQRSLKSATSSERVGWALWIAPHSLYKSQRGSHISGVVFFIFFCMVTFYTQTRHPVHSTVKTQLAET